MPDVVSDGKTRVAWVPTITTITAPTVAQINAGEDLEDWLTAEGWAPSFGNDAVDTTSLSSTFSSSLPGRQTLSTELTIKDQGRLLPPWSTFAGKPDGFLVVRRLVDAATPWTVGDKVEVYPVQAGTRRPAAPAANEVAKFMVTMFHTSKPALDATVA